MNYIYQYDKRHDVTYVYEKAEKINSKTGETYIGRKIVGRLDPKTNTIVATGKRGRHPTNDKKQTSSLNQNEPDYARQYKETNIELKKTQAMISELSQQVDTYKNQMAQVRTLLCQSMQVIDEHTSVT